VNESTLAEYVVLRQPADLPFADHVHRLISLDCVQCALDRTETEAGNDTLLNEAVILFNGLTTNDKFCLTVTSPVKLTWARRPRAGIGVPVHLANLSEDVRKSSGGEHATELANSTSAATDSRRGAAVGSSLSTSPGMDPVGRAQSSPAGDSLIPGGSERR